MVPDYRFFVLDSAGNMAFPHVRVLAGLRPVLEIRAVLIFSAGYRALTNTFEINGRLSNSDSKVSF